MKALVGVGVQYAGWQEPPRREAVHPVPVQVAALAAALQSRAPVPGHLRPDGPDVAGHRVVGHVAAYHAAQPPPLLRDGLVPTLLELVFDLFQLGPHPLGDGDPPDLETSHSRLRAGVRETEEIERLRLPGASRRPAHGREPAELDQARLARAQLQGEPCEPVAEVPQELPGVSQMLEPGVEVADKTHDDHVAARVPPPPPPGPQVKDIVQVDVRQQRGWLIVERIAAQARTACDLARAVYALREG